MIPDSGQIYRAEQINAVYRNGFIIVEYRVLVPDRTISGDYRYESVKVQYPAVPKGD